MHFRGLLKNDWPLGHRLNNVGCWSHGLLSPVLATSTGMLFDNMSCFHLIGYILNIVERGHCEEHPVLSNCF